jgi:hypothetical protein
MTIAKRAGTLLARRRLAGSDQALMPRRAPRFGIALLKMNCQM